MAGQNIQRLLNAVAGMDRADVETSKAAWEMGYRSLERVVERLSYAAPQVREGFGRHSESGIASEQALFAVRDKVARRRQDMADAAAALQLVLDAMDEAKDASAAMPRGAPGPAPRLDLPPGSDIHQEVTALKVHAARTRQHDQQVAAYDEADARAEEKMRRLNDAYGNAGDALARIHGEPVTMSPSGSSGGAGPSAGGPVRPSGGSSLGGHHTLGALGSDGRDGPADGFGPQTGGDTGIGSGGVSDQPTSPDSPAVVDPGTEDPEIANPAAALPAPTGDGPTLGGPAGGAGLVGLGLLGGAGLRGIRGGGGSPVATGGTPTRPIGGTTRTAASGTLGRSTGAALPAQVAGRGAGARGAAGTAPAGARGAAAAAVPGRARGRKDDEREPEKDVYAVEDEWTADEERYPGVIDQGAGRPAPR